MLLSGCTTLTNYFSGEDNAEPPAPLVEFETTADIDNRWTRSIGNGSDEQYLKMTPAIAGERIYAAARNGDVTALALDSGRVAWSHDTDEPLASATGAADGLVLVGSSNGKVMALDADSGEPLWKQNVSSEVLAAPQVADGVVVVRTVDGKLTGLSADSGDQLWVYDRSVPALSLRGTSSPVIHNGVILAGFDAGRLLALELSTGKALWETRVAMGSGGSDLERMVDIDARPVIRNDIVYVATYQGRVAAISVNGGRMLWNRDVASYAGLDVDEANVYVTADNGHVWALEQISGASAWRQEDLQARATTAPVVLGPYVAVGGVEGHVHWMDRDSGEFVARTRIDESPLLAAPVSDGETVYFYSSDGELAAYTYK